MSNNRELKIILKADGSIAVEELNKVEKELTDLGKGAAKTSKEVEKLDKELEATSKDAVEAAKNIDKAEKEIADLGKSSGMTEKIIERLDKIVDHFGKESNSAAKEIDRLEKEVVDLGRQLGMTAGNIDKLEKELRDLSRETEKNSKKVKTTTTTWADFATGMNQVWEIAGKVNRALGSGWELAKQGSQLKEARSSFDDYTRSVGASSDQIISKLKQASGGTIDDMSLIITASKSMSLGVTQDADKMGNLLLIARNKARLFGMDTTQAFNDIVTGIGRASPLILDNLGIRIPAGFEKMTEGMSDAEKVAKLFELTLIEGNKQLSDMGGLTNSSADDIRAFEAEVTNLKASLGALLAETFIPFTREIRNLIPDIKALMEQVKLLAAVANVPGQIAATLYYNKEIKKNPETLADAKAKYYSIQEEITAIRKKMAGLKPGSKAGWLADAAKYSAGSSQLGSLLGGVDSYIGLDSKSRKLQDYADQLELMIVQLENAEKKLAQKSFTDSIFAGLEKEFSDTKAFSDAIFAELERDLATELNKNGDTKKKTGEAAKKAEQAGKEAERLATERNKRLFQAIQGTADRQWKELAQSVEDAALAPLGNIVDQYELTGKNAITALLNAMNLSGANLGLKTPVATAAIGSLELDKAIVADFKKVEAGADQMQRTIEVAADRAIKNLMAITAAAAGDSSLYAALMKVDQAAANIPDLIAKIKAEVVSEEIGDYNKIRYESIPTIDVGDMGKEKTQKDKLSKIIAEAVSAGFANVDFSNFSQTFGNILSQILAKSVAQSNPIMDTAGKISWGNVGTNIAVNWALGKLTGTGGLFGARKENGKEAIQQASDLRGQMGQAYTKSYEASNLAYLYSGMGGSYLNSLAAGRAGYFGTQLGYSYEDSGNGIWSKKTRTYALVDQGATAALKTLTEAIENAEKYNRGVEMSYELMTAQGKDFQALLGQSKAYASAAASVSGDIKGLTWTDGSKDTVDLAESAHEIKIAAAELARQLGQATAERVASASEGFTKYAPWLNSIQTPGSTTVNTGLRISMRDMGLPYDPRPKSYLNYADMSDLSSAQQYDAFSSLQTDFLDRKISTYLLDMVKQAGQSMFDLNSLQVTDLDSYQAEYVSYIDKQMQAFEEVMKRQEEIFYDEAKTYEERASALELYERNMESYHQAKLDKLRLEKQQQEEENRLIAEQRQAKIEAGLSLVGEVAQRGDKIMILQGGDVDAALTEYMAEFADNPEVLAVLRKAKTKMDATARWG